MKKQYQVSGTVTVSCRTRVMAESPEEALRLARSRDVVADPNGHELYYALVIEDGDGAAVLSTVEEAPDEF